MTSVGWYVSTKHLSSAGSEGVMATPRKARKFTQCRECRADLPTTLRADASFCGEPCRNTWNNRLKGRDVAVTYTSQAPDGKTSYHKEHGPAPFSALGTATDDGYIAFDAGYTPDEPSQLVQSEEARQVFRRNRRPRRMSTRERLDFLTYAVSGTPNVNLRLTNAELADMVNAAWAEGYNARKVKEQP